jgi:RNA polymerase sigma-70 factor, ECF subfamily
MRDRGYPPERWGNGMSAEILAAPIGLAGVPDAVRAMAGEREDDREAILACQAGDRAAFDRLVERHQREIYRLCFRYVNNHEDASDLAQDSFVKAYKAIGRFRGDSAFSTWLYRIAVNTCLNFRATRRMAQEELKETLADPAKPVVQRMQERERSQLVRDAVTRLPEKQRATLILKIYHDLTHEEVAAILGSSVGTVKANLFHAMGNLRKMLGTATPAEVGE